MNQRSRALVVTNPNNPDGHLPSRAETDELLALAARHDLIVITDEAYERCIHDGELARAWGAPNVILVPQPRQEPRDARLADRLRRRRVGGIDACLRELELDVIRVSHVAQRAATAALEGPRGWLDEVAEGYRRDRDAAHAAIAEHPVRAPHSRPRHRSSGSSSACSRRRTSSPRASRWSTAPPLAHPATRAFRSEVLRSTVAEGYRIGVDIGGTFTDVVLLGADGTLRTRKVLSTPDDYSRGVVAGILELSQATGVEPGSVTRSSTRPRSRRTRSSKGRRPDGPAHDGRVPRRARDAAAADPGHVRPPRRSRRRSSRGACATSPERGGPPRQEWPELDAQAVRRGRAGAREASLDRDRSAAFVREPRARARVASSSATSSATTSTRLLLEILPEIREYERTSTTVVNAYVGPVVARYLALARVAQLAGPGHGAAADHAVERRDDERRGARSGSRPTSSSRGRPPA